MSRADSDLEIPETSAEDFAEKCKHITITGKKLSEITELFTKAVADGSEGLDIDEFCVAMQDVFPDAGYRDLRLLHMKIDTNCDGVVELEELLEFFVSQHAKSQTKADLSPFPLPPELISLGTYKRIVKVLSVPSPNTDDPNPTIRKPKTYSKCDYVAMTENGIFTILSDGFAKSRRRLVYEKGEENVHAHSKYPRYVYDMVYIKDLDELAVSTSEEEVLFFDYNSLYEGRPGIKYCITSDDRVVTSIDYTRINTMAIFSIADASGTFTICLSKDVLNGGLFPKELLRDMGARYYQGVSVSTLLKNKSNDFYTLRIPVFSDILASVQHVPQINSFIICGRSGKFMSVVNCRISACLMYTTAKPTTFESGRHLNSFNCAAFTNVKELLISGGGDGVLRTWTVDKALCQNKLTGHQSPIISIKYSDLERKIFSVSTDKNVRIWNESDLTCLQSFVADCLKMKSLSAVCYEESNNELILADMDLARFLGRGTDVFQQRISSHDLPLWDVIYNSQYKQLVSLSQYGFIRVWDFLTGELVLQFDVLSYSAVKPAAIMFDSTNRKLIVVSKNKEIEYWNFNNGKKVDVLPVKVPNHMTGLIQRKDKLFISAMNCNTIFALDAEEGNHRYLQHPLLKDTCAMELHEDRLIAISSDGNAVVWDLQSYRVSLYLHIFDSPKMQCVGKKSQGVILEREPLLKDLEDSELLASSTGFKSMGGLVSTSLKRRETNSETASLLVSYDGFVFAWSIQVRGGLIAKFRAVTKKNAKITCMTTDEAEKILLTADSTGRICLWDIQGYADRTKSDPLPSETVEGWHTSLCAPPLLRSWQGSNDGIVSVSFCPDSDTIISAGQDHNVKIWTTKGDFIGTFMKDRWDPSRLMFPESKDRKEFKKPEKTDSDGGKTLKTNALLERMKQAIEEMTNHLNKENYGLQNYKSYSQRKKLEKSKHVAHPPATQSTRLTRIKTGFGKTEGTPKTLERTTKKSNVPVLTDKKKVMETKPVALPPISQRTTLTRTKTGFGKTDGTPWTPVTATTQSHIPISTERKKPMETKLVPHPPVSENTRVTRIKTGFVKTQGTPKTPVRTTSQLCSPAVSHETKQPRSKFSQCSSDAQSLMGAARTKSGFVKTDLVQKNTEKTARPLRRPLVPEIEKPTKSKLAPPSLSYMTKKEEN